MKKSFLAVVLLSAIFMTVSSQDYRMWVGGTLSLSGQDNGQTQTTTTIMPEFGYNTGSAWAVGARAGFTTERSVVQGNTRRYNTTTIIPFARYRFGDIAGFRFFGQGELPIRFFGGRHYDGSSMESSNSIGFMVRPGLEYHFSERWGFNMLMPSVLSFVNNSNGSATYQIGVNDGYTVQSYLLSTSIGFIYSF